MRRRLRGRGSRVREETVVRQKTRTGDCASNFARFVSTYVAGRALAVPWTFSSGNACFNDAATDRALNRTCAYECKSDAARCKEFGTGPRTCDPPPPRLAAVYAEPAGGRFAKLSKELGLDRRPDDY